MPAAPPGARPRRRPPRGGRRRGGSEPTPRTGQAGMMERSLGSVLDFMRALWAIDHGLLRASKAMRRTLGVTGPQRLVVRIVGRYPGISAGELAAVLHLHPSTLTGVLRRLVLRRLLERVTDARDARRALFKLTKKGREVAGPRPDTVEAKVRNALRFLDPRDVATAETVLQTVAGGI